MRSLSKEAETKLLAAIERAAALVNDGMAPNDAIIKSASDANIQSGHVNIMVHAYNTGRTNKQRELGGDTLEKSADFPLADVDVVMAALYPTEVKTAAEIHRDTTVSTDYAISAAGLLSRRNAALTKAAAAQEVLPEKTYQPYPRDEHAAAMRDYSRRQAEKRAAEELRRQTTDAYSKAAVAMETLQEYFRNPANMSFPDAVRETGLRLGDEAVSVLKKLAEVYPYLNKQADSKNDYFGRCEPCELVEQVMQHLDEYNELKKKSEALTPAKVVEKKAAPAILTGSILHEPTTAPLTLKEAAGERGGSNPFSFNPGKTLSGLGSSMVGEGFTSVFDQSPDKLRARALMSLTDPEHERKLHNIRSRGVLHDLILNDPVISGYDPGEVANAYNELAELAPSFTSSSAVMSSLLRKRLQAGQLADFDLKQIVDLESAKTEQKKNIADAQKQQIQPSA